MSDTVKVLIADDEELTRTGLRTLLSAHPDLDVVGEAVDGNDALIQTERLRPDVVLMDVQMPVMDGIVATRMVLAMVDPPPRVIVLTTFDNDEYVCDALLAGASGFLLKRSPTAQIAHAIRLVHTGDAVLFADVLRGLFFSRRIPSPAPQTSLTDRELEVLRQMAVGLSNPEIADKLFVSLETVKTHVGSILMKLSARNRTQAVIFAYESGLVSPGG